MKICIIKYQNNMLLNKSFFIKTYHSKSSWLGYLVINRKNLLEVTNTIKADYYAEFDRLKLNENFLVVIKHMLSDKFIQRPSMIVGNSLIMGKYPIFRAYNSCAEYRTTRYYLKLKYIVPCFFRQDIFISLNKGNISTIEYLYINIICANVRTDIISLITAIWFMFNSFKRKLKCH